MPSQFIKELTQLYLFCLRNFILTRFFYSLCLVLLTSTVSLSLWAATLTVSDNLIVTEIDNKVVEHGLLSKKAIFSLNKGTHAFIVFYKDVFEDFDIAEERVIKSKDFVVKFTLLDEQHLKLTTAVIKNLAQAEFFSKSPKLIIKDEHNNAIELELEDVSDYKIAQQVDIAVSAYASKNSIKNGTEPQMNNTSIQVNSLTMLKYWWQNTSDEEKKYFKEYINPKN